MTLANPLPWFAICALCLAVASAIALASGFYRERLAEGGGRFEAIDGLRGFLALGVLGGHAVNMYTLHASGTWFAGVAPFYGRAAVAGVSLFFMITGFLFWLRVLRSNGALDARAFFVSRLRRLVPMYAVSVAMVFGVVAVITGFVPREPAGQLLREVLAWASFGFVDTAGLNGLDEARYINAVYWTLAFEWAFYIALPFLALFARGAPMAALFVVAALFASHAPVVLNFVFGALAAVVVHRRLLGGARLSPWLLPLALAGVVAFIVVPVHRMLEFALLFPFFLLVVHGESLFGLLFSRPAKVLGAISYSLYLTHCIVLFVTVRAADRLVGIETLGLTQYWLLAALAALATVVLSAFTYQYVEYPFLHPKAAPARRVAAQAA